MTWAFFVPRRRYQQYIFSRLYVLSKKTKCRVTDLSSGDVYLKKQHLGPLRKLSDQEDLLTLDANFDNPEIHLDEL